MMWFLHWFFLWKLFVAVELCNCFDAQMPIEKGDYSNKSLLTVHWWYDFCAGLPGEKSCHNRNMQIFWCPDENSCGFLSNSYTWTSWGTGCRDEPEKMNNENCTISIPKKNSYWLCKSSARDIGLKSHPRPLILCYITAENIYQKILFLIF